MSYLTPTKYRIKLVFYIKKLAVSILHFIENSRGKFITIRIRPVKASEVKANMGIAVVNPKTAILIRGEIIKPNDFTLETVRTYKKLHPQVPIVVSTWNDEEPAYLEKIYQAGAEVVLVRKPSIARPFHLNFQITTTIAGIEKAAELGVEYILNTRNDQRIYAPKIIDHLHNLTRFYPPENSQEQNIFLKNRIIALGTEALGSQLYHLSDEFLFGHIKDMTAYWRIDLLTKPLSFGGPENHLFTTFLKTIGREVKFTMEDTLEDFARYCIIIDPSHLDLYWRKHQRHLEYRSLRFQNKKYPSIFFLDWLKLYYDFKNREQIKK